MLLNSLIYFFFLIARFDVYRHERQRYFFAVVKDVDFFGSVKRIFFHFAKTSDKFDEWVEFGSPRICAFNSKACPVKRKVKHTKMIHELDVEKQLSVAAATISKGASDQSEFQCDNTDDTKTGGHLALSLEKSSEFSDVPHSGVGTPTLLLQANVDGASDVLGFDHDMTNFSIGRCIIVEQQPERLANSASFSASLTVPERKADLSYRVPRPFVEASKSSSFKDRSSQLLSSLEKFSSMDSTAWNDGNGKPTSAEKCFPHQHKGQPSHPHDTAAFSQPPPAPAELPVLTTAPRNAPESGLGSLPRASSLLNCHSFLHASPTPDHSARVLNSNLGLSGLDILAVVTTQHAFAAPSSEVMNAANPAPTDQPNGLRHPLFQSGLLQFASSQQRFGRQQQQHQQVDPTLSPNEMNRGYSPAAHW